MYKVILVTGNMKKLISLLMLLLLVAAGGFAQKKIMFDLSHSQCRGIEPGHETYPKVVPAYQEMAKELGAELVLNEEAEITKFFYKETRIIF